MPDDRPSAPASDPVASPSQVVVAARRRHEARRASGVADVLLGVRGRLDDRTRTAASLLLDRAVADVARSVGEAARLAAIDVPARLEAAGLLRDPDLVAEAIAQARMDAIDAGLARTRPPGATLGLIARLADAGDREVRDRANDYLVADNRRQRAGGEWSQQLHARIAWWCAAALREGGGQDAVLAQAVAGVVDARRAGGDVAGAASRLARAIDARPGEREPLLLDTLHDGRMALFVAVLAAALDIDPVEVGALTLDPDGDALWLALRAAGVSRDGIARIGWALCEADRERDVERLPDAVAALDGVSQEAAARALSPLALDVDFRDAIRALDGIAA